MISDFYSNIYITYSKSGSMTADGTYVYSGSTDLSGSCRIDPSTDDEGYSTHKLFMDVVTLDHVDTIYVDGIPYEIKGIYEYQNRTAGHHLELDLFVV